MRDSTKDRSEGRARELKGKVKEAAGVLTDNSRLKSRGRAEKVTGKIQRKVGEVKRVLED